MYIGVLIPLESPQDVQGIRIPVGQGIAGTVALSGDIINIPDAYNDPRFNPDIDTLTGFKTKSILCLPLRLSSGQVIAVLQVIVPIIVDVSGCSLFASAAGVEQSWRGALYRRRYRHDGSLWQRGLSLCLRVLSFIPAFLPKRGYRLLSLWASPLILHVLYYLGALSPLPHSLPPVIIFHLRAHAHTHAHTGRVGPPPKVRGLPPLQSPV